MQRPFPVEDGCRWLQPDETSACMETNTLFEEAISSFCFSLIQSVKVIVWKSTPSGEGQLPVTSSPHKYAECDLIFQVRV